MIGAATNFYKSHWKAFKHSSSNAHLVSIPNNLQSGLAILEKKLKTSCKNLHGQGNYSPLSLRYNEVVSQ